MVQDSLTNIVGTLVFIGGCIFMARWLWIYSQENDGRGLWGVWFALIMAVLGTISLLNRLYS